MLSNASLCCDAESVDSAVASAASAAAAVVAKTQTACTSSGLD